MKEHLPSRGITPVAIGSCAWGLAQWLEALCSVSAANGTVLVTCALVTSEFHLSPQSRGFYLRFMRGVVRVGVAPLALAVVFLLLLRPAWADDARRSISVGTNLLVSSALVCRKEADVVACTTGSAFAGADFGARYAIVKWLALGARFAGDKSLDRAKGVSEGGGTSENTVRLWRLSAEATFSPSPLPRGLWVGAEIGAAFVVDGFKDFDGIRKVSSSDSTTQFAPLFGAAIGWNFFSEKVLSLGIALRTQMLLFSDDPPKRNADGSALVFGTFGYLELGLRLTYRF